MDPQSGAISDVGGDSDGSNFVRSILKNLNNSDAFMNFTFPENYTKTFPLIRIGRTFYTYFTPVIIIVGLLGNSISLSVFLSRNLRRLSASQYLAALSVSDMCSLVFYVLLEWLNRGLALWPREGSRHFYLLHTEGFCQLFFYLSYTSRFLSAWLVVSFTVERYLGVCHPFRKRQECSASSTRKTIVTLVVVSAMLTIYKPVMSGVFRASNTGFSICTGNPHLKNSSFILDTVFAMLITPIPFVIITILNVLIIRALVIRNKRQKECKLITEENIIRLEFTFILLVISFCFIGFNLPFFVVWSLNFMRHSDVSITELLSSNSNCLRGLLWITRTIFYVNYCVNFFLYSITGAYFRQELRMLFSYNARRNRSYPRRMRFNTNSRTRHSWL